jgi:hypothetical protein
MNCGDRVAAQAVGCFPKAQQSLTEFDIVLLSIDWKQFFAAVPLEIVALPWQFLRQRWRLCVRIGEYGFSKKCGRHRLFHLLRRGGPQRLGLVQGRLAHSTALTSGWNSVVQDFKALGATGLRWDVSLGRGLFDKLIFTLTDASDVGAVLRIIVNGEIETVPNRNDYTDGTTKRVLVAFGAAVKSATIIPGLVGSAAGGRPSARHRAGRLRPDDAPPGHTRRY